MADVISRPHALVGEMCTGGRRLLCKHTERRRGKAKTINKKASKDSSLEFVAASVIVKTIDC